jgi:hypothetical protein
MFDSIAELLRGLAFSLLIALVLLLALPGAKAGSQPVIAPGAGMSVPGN